MDYENSNLEIPKTKGDIGGYELTLSLIQNDRTWICKKTIKFVIKLHLMETIENEKVTGLYQRSLECQKIKSRIFFQNHFVSKTK